MHIFAMAEREAAAESDVLTTALAQQILKYHGLFDAEKKQYEFFQRRLSIMREIGDLGRALGDLALTVVDRHIAKLDEQYRKEIEGGRHTAKEKIKIEEDYHKKRNQLLRRAAIVEKVTGLFSVAIDTAKGIMNAASKVATIPLIPFIAALGAVQAAVVAAQPVPMEKGGIVPPGYPNDTYPALLTSGEKVTPPGKLSADRPITVVLQGNLSADMQEIRVALEQANELHNQTT